MVMLESKVSSVFVTAIYSLFKKKFKIPTNICFKQLLTNVLSTIYILIRQLFIWILKKLPRQAPKLALGNNINMKGYCFHLIESTHFKLQQLGLKNKYRENYDFSIF